MTRKWKTSRPPPAFTKSEIEEMEKSFLKVGEPFDKNFCEILAEKINVASGRSRKRALHWKQIQRWFWFRQRASKQGGTENAFYIVAKELIPAPEINASVKSSENVSDVPADAGVSADHILELEALSSRDSAWYDVDTILSCKHADSGELEALVHFRDFSSDDDEWVNVKKAIRKRSIPVDSTKCQTVSVGDHVLCFWVNLKYWRPPFVPSAPFHLYRSLKERDDRACHYDAHVLNIQRKLHDIRGCRCRFLVQYDHDKSLETLPLESLCRRP